MRAIVTPTRSKTSRFEIVTPVAVAAVRSTDWMIEHKSKGETNVFVGEGAVAVTSVGAQVGRVILDVGDGTSVETGKAPQAPRIWGRGWIDNFRERTAVN